MTHPDYKSIALIDLSYLFKRRYHTQNDGTPMAAAKAAMEDIRRLTRDVDHIILCLDAPPYEHRKVIHPEYKANRPAPAVEEKAQRSFLYKELDAQGYNMARAQGYEADDVIATLADTYAEWCEDVRIVCPDKDAAQLVNSRIRQFIPPVGERDWEVRDVNGVRQKFGVDPVHMPLFQALMGDPGDNVPGVPKVGEKTAAALVNKYPTLQKLAEGLATEAAAGKKSAVLDSLAANWESLVLSLKLVTLETVVPIDADALLVKQTPQPKEEKPNVMDLPANDSVPDTEPANDAGPTDDELIEREAAMKEADKQAVLEPLKQRIRERLEEKRLAKTEPAYTESKYGMCTTELQPLDLKAAYTMSEWFMRGGLFRQYENAAQIFTIMVRAKELGVGMAMALANHHIVEGKPVAHADLVRALAERDPNFEYLMPTEMSAERCTWEGKHKKQPKPVTYTYTIEMAKQAGLVRSGSYGKAGNWVTRPQDMLMKTAATKLARLLWPGATMGLYCPEEMGLSSEELEARAAA